MSFLHQPDSLFKMFCMFLMKATFFVTFLIFVHRAFEGLLLRQAIKVRSQLSNIQDKKYIENPRRKKNYG